MHAYSYLEVIILKQIVCECGVCIVSLPLLLLLSLLSPSPPLKWQSDSAIRIRFYLIVQLVGIWSPTKWNQIAHISFTLTTVYVCANARVCLYKCVWGILNAIKMRFIHWKMISGSNKSRLPRIWAGINNRIFAFFLSCRFWSWFFWPT